LKVSVIGAGVIGTATGVGLSRVGHDVIFYDIAGKRRRELKAEGYSVAERLDAVIGCDVHFICVPTPVPGGVMDFSYVESAVSALAKVLTPHDRYQVVVIRSTVLPLTIRNRIIPLFARDCRLTLGKHYSICHNPEFLREACALEDFLNPPVIVIGTDDEQSAGIMKQVYAPFKVPLVSTTPENAEAIKIFTNVYNATKVSFFNDMYLIAQKLGLDHKVISQTLTKSSLGVRIPEYYTKGGYPFGGVCLPKDLAALITFLKEQRLDPGFFEEVSRINEEMKKLEK
jgi:UDPglucose 6-dehydrogenase